MRKKIGILCLAVLLTGLLVGVFQYQKTVNQEQIENAGAALNAVRRPEFLTYQGTEYPIRKHLQSVLLIGTDSVEKYEEDPEGLKPFYNYHQADFLLLIVLDKDGQKVDLIHLNRDTMTDVPWLDVLGDYGGTQFEQLCLAFNSGSGGRDSCRNTENAVSSLLFGAPIDAYLQIPMTAIPVLNDLVGGVPVTIRENLTAIDPAFVQGATVTLSGAQAEKFVRARKALVDDTNIARMSRQRDYMDSFQQCARKALNSDSEFVMKMLDQLSTYLQTEMTGEEVSDLVQRLDTYEISPIQYAQGKQEIGKEYYEFYVDQDDLWQLVMQAFC